MNSAEEKGARELYIMIIFLKYQSWQRSYSFKYFSDKRTEKLELVQFYMLVCMQGICIPSFPILLASDKVLA